MKPLRFWIQSLLVIFAAVPALAVNETWDAGGANDDFSTGANWADNSAPVSSLTNTAQFFGSGSLTANGDSFDLFDAGAIAGSWDEANLPALTGDLEWDATRLQPPANSA